MTFIGYDTFSKCLSLNSIEFQSSLPFIVKKKFRRYNVNLKINDTLGTIYNVIHNAKCFSSLSHQLYKRLGMGSKNYVKSSFCDYDDIFVNWRTWPKTKNKDGRLLLFTALEQNIKWSNGLGTILEANGAAIEEVDLVTGLEAFMLAAVGKNSNMETVYKLLQDHPGAIIPYGK